MKPRSNPLFRASRLALAAITFGALPVSAALSTWDGGAGDTNIDSADNWNPNGTPTFDSSLQGLFQTTTAANINTNVTFGPTTTVPAVAFNSNFTMNAGGGILTLYGTNSGIQSVLRTNSGASSVTINSPIEVFSTAPSVSPRGNLLVITVNNATAANTALNIAGGISRAGSSTAATYDIRFGNNVTAGVVAAKAKISGPISGLGSIVNANTGGAQWSGDLIIAGDQASVSSSNITIASTTGFGTPQTTARIVLGESNADDQAWNNITLNNVMNLAIGGNITANAFSGNTANTRITGASATGNIAFNSGTIGANVVLGGAGTNQNDLSIIKKSSGTLNINSTTATYTGPTTVEAGTLNISSATALASPITVKAGGTLTGEGSTTSSLTFDTGTSTLGFDTTSPGSLTVASLVTTGTVIASPSGATSIGVPYTVLTNSGGNFSAGDVSAFLAGGRGTIGGAGTNQITYTPSAPASLAWKGNDGTNPTFWDLATTFNWNNGSPDRFFGNDSVTFDDTATTFTVAVQGSSASPGNIVFNNTLPNPYTLSGGSILGGGSLTKNNTGTVTIPNTLSHTGGITVNAGILSLGTTNTNTFTGGINITGGELQFGGATLLGSLNAQPVTMTGGTLTRVTPTATTTSDTQTFAINANGVEIKTDTNTNTTWRIGGKISGSGNWTKSGAGVLSFGRGGDTSPANDFTGTLTVTAGTLDIRHGDSLGSTVGGTSVQDAILLMQNFGQTSGSTITVDEPLEFSGAAFLNGYNQENKTFTQQFNGPVTIAADAVIGISTARNSSGAIAPLLELNGSTITTGTGSVLRLGLRPAVLPANINAAAQTINIGSAIDGPGSVIAQGESGSVYTLSAPGYSGNTTVNSATFKLDAPNTNNQSSTVTIAATGAALELNFDETGGPVTDTVDKLFIGGIQQNAGIYKAVDNITDAGIPISQITGPGTLTVTSNPPPVGGYSAWQTTNGATGQTVDQDHDNDGVDNGVEYFIGGNTDTTGFTPTPVLNASNNITWTMGDTYTGTYGTDYVIQTSSDLSTWDPVAEASVTIDNVAPGKSVSYTLTGSGKRFVRLLVNPN